MVDNDPPRLSRPDDYQRYGRQMILEGFGLEGQLKLQNSSVVVVGAGGLGCPALQYLAAAGIGRLGVIDHDTVELSNLQRQILHTDKTIGSSKAVSAAQAIAALNPRVNIDVCPTALDSSNALSILAPYDVILDCTDNAPTRYLLSDSAVRLKKPLVSGAAQKFDGQLCIYNLGDDGPCYRCIFPKPPAPEMAGSCEETGILGAVTGIIGNLQALEAMKLITGLHDGKASLLLFSALSVPPFRTVKLRSRKPTCAACGIEGQKVGTIEETDYVAFCGGARPNWLERGLKDGEPESRIYVKELKSVFESNINHTIIDVRPRTEFGICRLPRSTSVPLNILLANPAPHLPSDKSCRVFVLCRLGNDSQIAADAIRAIDSNLIVKDVIGGLRAWSNEIDPTFPVY
ncbi:uncharacterized protein F5147DRAFT_575040 [Suillus discolor]|uniref:Needs CLA4 to survive protein 3 n=1 Tax=Suillus discolor TaxID=1912936 RepID=A0A9P7JV74_9AGAM|nr:uncharacterized protein F5147DRAFT_575040 [Suillus discolor]KAG2110302.1 hypothetical protein F5147DRAFT_575040 [Suillus discolor]